MNGVRSDPIKIVERDKKSAPANDVPANAEYAPRRSSGIMFAFSVFNTGEYNNSPNVAMSMKPRRSIIEFELVMTA